RSHAPEPRRTRRRACVGTKDDRADDVGPPGRHRPWTRVLRRRGLHVGPRARGARGPRRCADGGFGGGLLLGRGPPGPTGGRSPRTAWGGFRAAGAPRARPPPARTRARP